MAAPNRSQINLITNNFKIRSKNHGVIYTYKVDFIEGSGPGGASGGGTSSGGGFESGSIGSSMGGDDQLSTTMSMMSLGKGHSVGGSNLETFQKFRIMNAHKDQLKKIYV
jgi:hypothetical protein